MEKDRLHRNIPSDAAFLPFRTGYVIELEQGRYFSGIKEGSICRSTLEGAVHFQSLSSAEHFVHRNLGYVGLRVQFCHICWTLVETESLEAEWKFLEDKDGSVVKFAAYQDAESYRRKEELQNCSMVELYAFREKELLVA